jgi:ABC-type sugar transport system permease subunit
LLMPVLVVVILFSTIFTLSDFNIVYVLRKVSTITESGCWCSAAY